LESRRIVPKQGKPDHDGRVSPLTQKTLCVVVMLPVVLVGSCVGWNRHPGNNCETENCEHNLAKLHLFPLKSVVGQFPADQPLNE